MNADDISMRALGGLARHVARLTGALTVVLTLGACSSTPEWADPTAVWDNVFGEEEDARPADARTADSDSSFPSLGSTPERPETSSAKDRREVASSLVADRENARYTDETLRLQGATAAPPSVASAQTAVDARARDVADDAAERADAMARTAEKTAMDRTNEAVSNATSATRSSGLESRAVTPSISRDRMQVPSIVQRSGRPLPPPTPIEEVARQRQPVTIVRSERTPAPPAPTQALQDKAEDAMRRGREEVTQAIDSAAPRMVKPAMADAMDSKPAMAESAMSAPADQGLASPAAMATAANVNLPVGQDQRTLEQVFANQLAMQNGGVGGQRAVLPATSVSDSTARTAFPDRPAASTATWSPSPGAQPANFNGDDGLRLPGAPLIVRFANSSAQLDGQGRKRVEQAARLLRERGGMVRVVGHASQRTADMPYARHKIVNFNVSLDRANAVARELTRRGVPRENIIVEARGDEDPLFHEFMPNGEAYNRRVEIYLQ